MTTRCATNWDEEAGRDDPDAMVLAIPKRTIRSGTEAALQIAQVIGDVLLGLPIDRADLARWGITITGLLPGEEADMRQRQGDLFGRVGR